MGLDVTAFNNVTYLEPLDWDRFDELWFSDRNKYETVQVNDHFPDSSVGVVNGIYELTEDSETHEWRAGSYGGYNIFREQLAASVGYSPAECWDDPEKYKDKPFYELVNYSDCEGTIGTEASKALYQDFVENRQKFVDYVGDYDFMGLVQRYDDWTEGFRIASNNGYVDLH